MDRASRIAHVVELARRHLGMDVAFLSEFAPGRQVHQWVSGDAESFGISVGASHALGQTYCERMVDGRIPHVVHDCRNDNRVRDLAVTAAARIGAYIGVPLRLHNGELYGTLCCLSHDAQPTLNERDVRFVELLGDFVVGDLADEIQAREDHAALRGVLDDKAVQVALQPVVNLVTSQCSSVEALARFPSHIGSPDVAFAKADSVGLRQELEVLAGVSAVRCLRFLPRDFALSLNLSPDVALSLIPRVEDMPWLKRIVLEMTEHAAVDSYELVRSHIRPFREQGLRLAIDDAGAGFASLRHIIELRPDIIKIDRSIVGGCDADHARRSVITTFVLLALDIGATVVAEGVETAAELETVTALGVDAAQGYFFATPTTDRDAPERWRHQWGAASPGGAAGAPRRNTMRGGRVTGTLNRRVGNR